MPGVSTPLGVLAAGAGVALIYSAITGQSPLTELRKALTSGKLDGPEAGGAPLDVNTPTINAQGGTDDGGAYGPPAPPGSGPPTLVPVPGNIGHSLSQPAATAFRQAEQNFGRSIRITGASRDYATQAAKHKAEPNRFGSPDGNAHVMGIAVDVNLGAVGANPQGSTPAGWLNDATYKRLYDAFVAAGWCNWQMNRGNTGGKIPEPWHFSYGRCG